MIELYKKHLKLLSEIVPLVIFFYFYKKTNIMIATGYMMGITLFFCLSYLLLHKKIPGNMLFSSGLLFVFGGFSLISGNPDFIKMKPTILYIGFASFLAIASYMKKPVIKYVFAGTLEFDDKIWYKLSYRFIAFFIFMAISNELVWRNFSESIWVNFKIFGSMPLLLLFILLQIPLINKHKLN